MPEVAAERAAGSSSSPKRTPHSSAANNTSYFAASRLKADVGFWVLSMTVFTVLCTTRTLIQFQCDGVCNDSACTPYLTEAIPDKDGVELFPCDRSLLQQARWVARSPALIWRMSWLHGSSALLAFFILGFLSLSVICIAPDWYVRGRNHVVAGARLLSRCASLLELLLLRQPRMTQAWIHACSTGDKGMLGMVFMAVALPVPLRTHASLALLEFAVLVSTNVLHLRHTASPAYLVCNSILTFLVGVICPSIILRSFEQATHARYLHSPPSAPLASSPSQPCTSQQGGKAASRDSAPVPARQTSPALAAPTPQQPVAAAPIPTPSSSQLVAARRPRRPYVSRMRTRMFSAKIHHHGAFQDRKAITAALESRLTTPSAPPPAGPPPPRALTPPPPASPPAVNIGALASTVPPESPALQPHTFVTTVALEGCLQLLVSMNFLQPGPCTTDLASLTQQLLASLPEPSRSDPITVGLVCQPHGCAGGLPAGCAGGLPICSAGGQPDGCAVGLPGGCAVEASGAFLGDGLGRWMVLEPACVEAGLGDGQEVGVELAGGWAAGVEAAEAVVCCRCEGREVVLRQPVALDRSEDGCGVSIGLALPPGLDAAPLEVHVLATCAAHKGALLGSVTTMALPPPAAQQLLLALDFERDDPAVCEGLRYFLVDLAAAWKLLCGTAAQQPPPEHDDVAAFVADMLRFLAINDLPGCEQYLRDLVARPAPVPGAAAAAPRLGDSALASAATVPSSLATSAAQPVVQGTLPPAASTAPMDTGSAAACSSRAAPRAPAPQPQSPALSSWLHPAAAWQLLTSCLRPPHSSAQWEARYAAWRLQQGRWLDVAAAASLALICTAHLGKRLLGAQHDATVVRQMAAWTAAQLAAFVLPWLLLASGSDGLRARRGEVIALQGLLRAAAHAASIFCLLRFPKVYQQPTRRGADHLYVFGVFIPALQAVSWKQQLLISFVTEELPLYFLLASPGCSGDRTHLPPGAPQQSLLQAMLVSGVAAGTSWAVDRGCRAAFARLAGGALKPVHKPKTS